MADMDKEIRESSGGDLQDKIEDVEGTYQFAPPEPEKAEPSGDLPGTDSAEAEQARQDFPRASEEEVHEAAERAQAKFGGTYGGGGGVEAEADEAVAAGEKPGYGSGQDAKASEGGTEKGSEDAEEGDALTTGQKFASVLGSDPNMQWESKIADKMSGGDDDKT